MPSAAARRTGAPVAYPNGFGPGERSGAYYLTVAVALVVLLGATIAVHLQEMIHRSARPGEGIRGGVVHSVPIKTRAIALTFDDGPDRHVTPPLLEVLKEFGVHCTFFMVGLEIERSPHIGRLVVDGGHEIGGHTFGHHRLRGLPAEDVEAELDRMEALLQEAYGVRPRLFRFPYLQYDSASLAAVQARGYTVVGCSVDSVDWSTRDPEVVAERVIREIKPGAIVLMHDVGEPNRERARGAVRRILRYLNEQGYRCVTVSELLEIAAQEERTGDGRD